MPACRSTTSLSTPTTHGVELIEPEDFLPGNPFPPDAQRMGIDRWSDDAGMIAVASSLDSRKLSHGSSPG